MLLKKIISNPVHYFQLFLAVLRGTAYIIYYSLFRRNIKIGFPFIVFDKVRIYGNGSVTIGKRCIVVENVFRGLSISTLSDDASVVIGDKSLLAGLTIRCQNYIKLGEHSMTAISLIQDSLFVNLNEAKSILNSKFDLLKSDEIVLGDNIWLGGQCCVLNGSTIGDDSVLAAGSMCYKGSINEYSIGSGSPIRRALSIEKLLAMRK